MNCPLSHELIQKVLHTSDFHAEEIRGGISKQVYKITTKTDVFILYQWLRPYGGNLTENQTQGMEYLFPEGFLYFIHNTKLLQDLGVRVPHIVTTGHDNAEDFDYAMVEYLQGQSLDEYMKRGGNVRDVADKIIKIMNRMAVNKRVFYGSTMETEPNDISAITLDNHFYTEELDIASRFDAEIAGLKKNYTI